MSINDELLRELYPEWYSTYHPFLQILIIFIAITIFLLVPYIYMKFIEGRFAAFWRRIRKERHF